MQNARGSLCVTSYAGKLLAIGGFNSTSQVILSTTEIYDPQSDSWSDAQIPLKSIAGVVIGCAYSSKYLVQD